MVLASLCIGFRQSPQLLDIVSCKCPPPRFAQRPYNEPVKRWRVVGLGVLALSFCALLIVPSGIFLLVPRSRDPRLIGIWERVDAKPDDFVFMVRIELRSDGTGYESHFPEMKRPLTWGTDNGKLVSKRMSVDAWVKLEQPYVLSADGNKLKLTFQRLIPKVANFRRVTR